MRRSGSLLVALGILLSRIFGLVRQRVLAHFLGQGDSADALNTAFRIPNFLQNLLGEGALSASFIPRYSRLLAQGDEEQARRLAGALLAVMLVTLSSLVLLGELATPWLMATLVSKDWSPDKRALTETLVRILFPGTGLMVLSAWCLGVLNSHRKFLLSYAAPVVWNLAIIGAIVLFARNEAPERFVVITAWGAVAGSLLQVLVQLPAVMAVGGRIVPLMWSKVPELRAVVRAFIPNIISRGANQISALVDLRIATSIHIIQGGAVAAMSNAQVLYLLPVSLFGMAVSAAELPEMAREQGDAATVAKALRVRLSGATQRLGFYIIPSALGFLSLGGVIAAAVYQTRTGRFTKADADFVWIVLAGSAFGLLASTLGRLYSSAFYALDDTRTPLYCGIVRVVLTGALGWFGGIVLPPMLGIDPKWGVAGLTATAGIAGWVEFAMLRRELCRRLGTFSLEGGELLKLWIAALVAAAIGTGARLLGEGWLLNPVPLALLAVPANAITYLAITSWMDIPEAAVLTRRIRRTVSGGANPT